MSSTSTPTQTHHSPDLEKGSIETPLDDLDEKASRPLPAHRPSAAATTPAPCSNPLGDDPEADHHSSAHDHESDEEASSGLASRVLSRVTSRSSVDPGPPPDGGSRAWCQVAAAHLVILNTWGFINSFGIFQSYYQETLNEDPSNISWIGSLSTFLLFFVGTVAGRLTDAGFFRPLFITGHVLLVGGVISVSFAGDSYWQLLLAQGLCMGLANGLVFCPVVAVLSSYFLRKRAIVLGIAACGSCTGGISFLLISRELLPKIGFAWTIRVIALITLVSSGAAIILARPRTKPRKVGSLVEWSAFKEMEYTFYAMGTFFCFWGVYFAFFYLAAFSRTALADPLSYTSSLNLLLALNAIGLIGRLAPNFFADRIGALNVFIPTALTASMLVLLWIAVDTSGGLYAWAIFYGIAAAGIQSLFPAALSFLTTDLRKLGTRMGMVFTIVSFAVLSGPPIAGAIISAAGEGNEKRGYQGAQAFAGSVIAMGCGFLTAAKAVKMKKTGQSWKGRM